MWRTVIKATGTISGDTRYEGDRERGPKSTQRQPEACGEKARLRLVHGMRTGQTRGIEHGRRWRASLEAEARQDGWDEEGGGACADGAEGCWHPGCCRTIANTRHVLCAECEAVKGERREHYREMRKGAADVLKARCEPELLEAADVVVAAGDFNKRVVKVKTQLMFTQTKFNLLREESEDRGGGGCARARGERLRC